MLKVSSFKEVNADLHPFFDQSYLHHFVLQKTVAHRWRHQRADFDHFLCVPETFLEVGREELDFFICDDFQQEVPVRLGQLRMPFDSKDKRGTASACIANEPSITISYFLEDFNCQLRNSLVFTNEAWLDCVEAGLSIAHVVLAEFFEFLQVFLEQTVEENDSLKVIVDSLHDEMSEVLVLVGKKAQNFFHRHGETRR